MRKNIQKVKLLKGTNHRLHSDEMCHMNTLRFCCVLFLLQFYCQFCYKIIKQRHHFVFHLRAVHKIGKPVRCEHCGKDDFNNRVMLDRHVKSCTGHNKWCLTEMSSHALNSEQNAMYDLNVHDVKLFKRYNRLFLFLLLTSYVRCSSFRYATRSWSDKTILSFICVLHTRLASPRVVRNTVEVILRTEFWCSHQTWTLQCTECVVVFHILWYT